MAKEERVICGRGFANQEFREECAAIIEILNPYSNDDSYEKLISWVRKARKSGRRHALSAAASIGVEGYSGPATDIVMDACTAVSKTERHPHLGVTLS